MTTGLIEQDKNQAKKKGYIALGAWGGSALLLASGLPVWLGAATVGGAGYLTYKWFMYRAKRGMRF